MGGSYKSCPGCGRRALSIATRCPGCGAEFPIAAEPEGAGGWKPKLSIPLSAPAVVLAGVGIVLASQVGRAGLPREHRSTLGAVTPVEVGAAGSGAVADSVPSATSPGVGIRSVATADHAPASAVLVAHRTIYLRQARSRGAALEAVLEAGDTLAVDSLAGGWYRVTFEGAVMGYAERGSLDALAARESS
ncbi:MAG TPA: hypothetical protein VF046_00765 [Gemmatimonadales bacterium]